MLSFCFIFNGVVKIVRNLFWDLYYCFNFRRVLGVIELKFNFFKLFFLWINFKFFFRVGLFKVFMVLLGIIFIL